MSDPDPEFGENLVTNPSAVGLDGEVYAVGGFVEVDETFARVQTPAPFADEHSFKTAMARLASGVVMVTTMVDGRPWGLTVSACCSVSVEPPLILVSLNRRTKSWKAIRPGGTFGVSILRAEQKALAEFGAAVGSSKFVDEFCEPDPAEPSSAPRIRGALCYLDCVVQSTHEAGTHALVVGRVTRAIPGSSEGVEPLIYFSRTFHQLGKPVK